MNYHFFQGNRWMAALYLQTLLLLAGCQTAMSTSNPSQPTQPRYDLANPKLADAGKRSSPLHFKTHSFGAYCYNTYGCKVLYNNFYHAREAEDKPAPPLETSGEQQYWNGDYGGVLNFPRPAIVTWRSLDGVSHEAKVDIGAIFKGQRILHSVPEQDIPERAYIIAPDIILVVNDHTVSVYMRARIPLKKPAIPGNRYSTFRDDLTLAYTHTY